MKKLKYIVEPKTYFGLIELVSNNAMKTRYKIVR